MRIHIYIESRYNLQESNLVWQKVAKQRSCCNDLWCRRRLRSRCSMARTKPTSCTTWRCQMKNRLKQQKTFMLFENSYTNLYVYWYHLISFIFTPGSLSYPHRVWCTGNLLIADWRWGRWSAFNLTAFGWRDLVLWRSPLQSKPSLVPCRS